MFNKNKWCLGQKQVQIILNSWGNVPMMHHIFRSVAVHKTRLVYLILVSGFEFSDFNLLNRLLPKSIRPSLSCYLDGGGEDIDLYISSAYIYT